MTYENMDEYKFMEGILGVKSGTLPNTIFCMLGPDGTTRLSRSGRGPFFAYANASAMASGMNLLAAKYPNAQKNALSDSQLPLVKRVDLALNVASCDNRMLIVTTAADKPSLKAVDQKLLSLSWSEQFAGQFVYGSTTKPADLKPLAGTEQDKAILVVEPGPYGVSGKVVAQLPAAATTEQIQQALAAALKKFEPLVKSHRSHIQNGYNLGIEWESVVEESDAQSVRAKQAFRARQRLQQ